jgi:hypothetical protein
VREIEKWIWRIKWCGRWTRTRIHWTEAEVRLRHPEAMRVEGSRIVVKLPETPAEIDAAMQPRGPR